MNNLVFSNVLHRPARTLVSILGISIGVLLVIFTVGLSNGSLRDKAQREANVTAEIMFCSPGTFCLSNSGSLRLPVSLVGEIEKVEGVKKAVPIGQNTISAGDNSFGSRLLHGIDFDEYAQVTGARVMEGRKFTAGADEIMTDTAWLPQKNLKIGDTLRIYERDFKIVGTYEPSAGARVKIPLSTMQKDLAAENKVSTILIKVNDGVAPEIVIERLKQKFPDDTIIFTKELEELYMSSIPALNIFLNVVIGVAATISLLVILLTMYTTVTERTRQIGILKSLGMSKMEIAWTIVQEALLMSIAGVIVGILLTLILSFVIGNWTTLRVEIEPQIILVIVIVGLISGTVGALFPALRAAQMDAVEALSYE
jgi:putative ABC transport system permease protein